MVSHDEKEKCMSADVTTNSGKTVLITGGGSGVGADMARAFASRGADVLSHADRIAFHIQGQRR